MVSLFVHTKKHHHNLVRGHRAGSYNYGVEGCLSGKLEVKQNLLVAFVQETETNRMNQTEKIMNPEISVTIPGS